MSRAVEGYDPQGNPLLFQLTAAQEANLVSLIGKANTALGANATFLAITSPTTAQVTAQVKALTRQVDALIKLALNDLTDTAGT